MMVEKVGKAMENFIGSFVEYDENNNTNFWRQYMLLWVKINVRPPLKKQTKVKNKGGKWCVVNFKYKKMSLFCFMCEILGHTELKCEADLPCKRIMKLEACLMKSERIIEDVVEVHHQGG